MKLLKLWTESKQKDCTINMNIIEYFDFADTKKSLITSKVLVGNKPIVTPVSSDYNFVKLVDEHNKLVAEFNDLKVKLKEEIKNIKYYTK